MSKINLLPWRKNIQDVQNRIFGAIMGVVILVGASIVYLVNYVLAYQIEVDQLNINYIDTEMASVRSKIGQIKGLQDNKKKLLDRMKVIQSLQLDKISTVQLLDLIPRVIPDSIYLTKITRSEVQANNVIPGPDQPSGIAGAVGAAVGITSTEQKKEEPESTKQYSIQLDGVALSNIGVSDLLKKLNAVEWVSDVKLNEVQASKDEKSDSTGLDFTVQFKQSLSGKDS